MEEQESILPKLVQNLEHLIEHTNLDSLLPNLLDRQVVAPHMREMYESVGIDERTRKIGLYFNMLHVNNHTVYNQLVEALLETGHVDLVKILNLKDTFALDKFRELLENNPPESEIAQPNTSSAKKHTTPFQLPDSNLYSIEEIQRLAASSNVSNVSNSIINLNTEPFKVKVKNAVKFFDDPQTTKLPIYSTHSNKRGTLLMINNKSFVNDIEEYRNGAEADEQNLEELFTQCGFKVEKHSDKGAHDMRNILKTFSQNEAALKGSDMIVISIMSHGRAGESHKNSLVVGWDGGEISVQEIIDYFNNDNCPILQHIPKIFIFQICRGSNTDYGAPRQRRIRTAMDSSTVNTRIRTYSDMFIAQSTLPGYTSHRDIHLGTWYIQSICKVFMEHAHDTHIEDLFKLVDDELVSLRSELGTMQTSSYENLAFKLCYLHPGLYKNT